MTGNRDGRSGIRTVTRWLGLLVVLVAGAVVLHRILPVFEGHLAVGVVAALLWAGLYAWQRRGT